VWEDTVDGAWCRDEIVECAIVRGDAVDAVWGHDYGVWVDGECVCIGLRVEGVSE